MAYHPSWSQVEKLQKQDTPDPRSEEMKTYERILKASHEAAIKELWGLPCEHGSSVAEDHADEVSVWLPWPKVIELIQLPSCKQHPHQCFLFAMLSIFFNCYFSCKHHCMPLKFQNVSYGTWLETWVCLQRWCFGEMIYQSFREVV